jgi:aminoglycoside phosphotransferase (APT) family kinase protein
VSASDTSAGPSSGGPGPAPGAGVEALLERFVCRRLPAATTDVHVGEVGRVAVGLSRENWVFDLHWTEGGATRTQPLIARRDPLGGLLDTDRTTEFSVLQALEPTAVPAPRALWLDADGSELGRPSLVMERGDGRCDYFVLNGDLPLARRVALAERLCDLLCDIHGLDWSAIGLDRVLADPGPDAARRALDEWVATLRAQQVEPLPELELVVDWLAADPPRAPRTVVVHGDFKAGNMLLDEEDRVVLLLDWELTHLGDPHDDLGWITQPLRTREHLIAGAWEVEQLFDRYERRTGLHVDRAAVRWWNVMACLKTAVMQVTGLASWLEGRTDTPYRLTNGCVIAALDLMDGR